MDSNCRVTLHWRRYHRHTDARAEFGQSSCVYVQTDPQGRPVRIGKAGSGLVTRYRGGTGYSLDASMHDSGNLFFAAAVDSEICYQVERELIWRGRAVLIYNNVGKRAAPKVRLDLMHKGESPHFSEFEAS